MEELTSLVDVETNLLSYLPELETVRKQPVVQNPFKSNLRINRLEAIKMCLLCILVPIRMILLGMTLFFAHIAGQIFLLGYTETDPETPFRGFRSIGQNVIYIVCRICLFACGYHRVNVTGSVSPDTRVLVAAPHSSFIDVLVVTLICKITAPTRAENLQHSFFGKILRLLQLIPVSRADKNSRIETIKEIKRRAHDKEWHPIVIFPEGTCTNRMSYIYFKPGAFIPGLPVQPVLLKYKDKLDYASWTWIGPGAPRLILIMMCQLYNTVDIEILPVYKPSDEEIVNPSLYACNVRDTIAKHDGIPITDHSFEDCRLMNEALKLKLPIEVGLVEYYKLNKLMGINCDFMIEQLQKFSAIDTDCDGYIDLEELCRYLHLPASKELTTLARIYDLEKNGRISFRDYLIGQFHIAKYFSHDESLMAVFDIMSQGGSCVTLPGLLEFMKLSMIITQEDVEKIFAAMDEDSSGQVTLDRLKQFSALEPMYHLIFMDISHRHKKLLVK